jgi:preprotein translocase subunit YajC
MFSSTAYAMAPQQGAAEAGPMGILSSFMPIILIIVIFYFLLIRPQQKKAKQHQEMLRGLKKGDAVITSSGIYGRIVDFQDDIAVVDLGEQKVFMLRSALSILPSNQKSPVSLKKTDRKKAAQAENEPEETEDQEE